MRTIDEIKVLLAQNGLTLTKVARMLEKALGKKYTCDNLSKKLRTDTIRYSEMKIIADVVGYELIFKKK